MTLNRKKQETFVVTDRRTARWLRKRKEVVVKINKLLSFLFGVAEPHSVAQQKLLQVPTAGQVP
jgi:hypothetical protein